MMSRVWHGLTTPENADTYENLLKHEIFAGIQNMAVLARFDAYSQHYKVRETRMVE